MEQAERLWPGPIALRRRPSTNGEVAPRSAPPAHFRLSVVMAARDEAKTVHTAATNVLALRTSFELELVAVDDGSVDGTGEILDRLVDPRLVVLHNHSPRGKGFSLLRAAEVATGTHLLVFDADLEYSADDIPSLVEPILDGTACTVYGSRVPGNHTAFGSFRYTMGSKLTTVAANVLFDAWVADMHTCLKLVPLPLFRQLSLHERGFGLDTEITAELLRRGVHPFEVPCSYRARSLADGKKLTARDGLACLAILLRIRLSGHGGDRDAPGGTPPACREPAAAGEVPAVQDLPAALARPPDGRGRARAGTVT